MICKQCGNINRPDLLYCEACGAKLEQTGSAEAGKKGFSKAKLHASGSANEKTVLKRGFSQVSRLTEQSPSLAGTNYSSYPWHHIQGRVEASMPTDEIIINPAPRPGEPPKLNWLTILAGPVGMLVVVLAIVLITNLSGGTASFTHYIFMLGFSLIGVVTAILTYFSQKKENTKKQQNVESSYRERLKEREQAIQDAAAKERAILEAAYPSAADCASFKADSRQLWNRTAHDKRFLSLRLGRGDVPLWTPITVPKKDEGENPLNEEARVLASRYSVVSDVPVSFDLKKHPTLGLVGPRQNLVEHAHALLVHLAALHHYEDLKIILIYPKAEEAQWGMFRWLPHVWDDRHNRRYLADSKEEAVILLKELAAEISTRKTTRFDGFGRSADRKAHLLFVIAEPRFLYGTSLVQNLTDNDPEMGVSAIFLGEDESFLPRDCRTVVELSEQSGVLYQRMAADKKTVYRPDILSTEQTEAFARTLAPVRCTDAVKNTEIPDYCGFLEGHGVRCPEDLPIDNNWAKNRPARSMAVPLGAVAGGVMLFDAHPEKSGAHGIFVGTNGSGKSSMIRSWILSMAVHFAPTYAAFVLVDFKGTGLLQGLEDLPHIAGTISNLDAEIQRNLVALESEIARRERLFKKAGVINIYDYMRDYEAGKVEEPIAFLYIVIDELAEFQMWANENLDNRMKLLERLYQTGRALGIHIIAGSQTTAPFTEKMEGNARFRWCLKTATQHDSQTMLKTNDAFQITAKGRAIVRVGDNEIYETVQPLFCDGVYLTPEEQQRFPERQMALVAINGKRSGAESRKANEEQATELEVTVARICAYAKAANIPSARQVWPERLPETLHFEELPRSSFESGLCAVVGLVDDPRAQTQYPLVLDFEKQGHAVVYGAPQSGKSTFLQTLACSLLAAYSPQKLCVYTIGAKLEGLAAFPQVAAAVLPGSDREKNLIRDLSHELKRRRKDRVSEPKLLLIVDDIGEILKEHREFFKDLASAGPGCGIYLAASAGDTGTVYPISSSLTTGYALWFSPQAYEYKTALAVGSVETIPPKEVRGRGITSRDGVTLAFHTALPPELLSNAVADVAQRFCEEKTEIRHMAMPTEIAFGSISSERIALGLDCDTLETIDFDFRKGPLLILGDDPAQREDLVLSVCRQAMRRGTVKEITEIGLYDNWPEVPSLQRLPDGPALDRYLESLSPELKHRLEAVKSGAKEQFPPIIVLIGDLKRCLDEVSELTRKRIANNLVLYGNKLSVFLAATCDSEDFLTLCAGHEESANRLASQNVVIFGREAERIAATLRGQTTTISPSAQGEGLWLPSDWEAKICRVKMMKGR